MSFRTVYLVDDDPQFRRSLARQLTDIGFETWPFSGPAHFLDTLQGLEPSSTLLSADMSRPDAIALLEALEPLQPAWPVLVLARGGGVDAAVRAMKLGAVDYLVQPVDPDQLRQALVAAGLALEKSIEIVAARRRAEERLSMLTPRELDVARALLRGLGNKAVAHQLGLSVRTVEMHRARMMRKLGARTIAEGATLLAGTDLDQAPLPARGSGGRFK